MEKRDPAEPPVTLQATPRELAEAIRAGHIPTDQAIDRYLPIPLRYVSNQYWTSVKVALRVSQWLNEIGARRVLDVGSGPGKFCVLAALATNCEIVGIEQRGYLNLAARNLARSFGVEQRVRFLHGLFGEAPLETFDAYYFYSPFIENIFGPAEWLDRSVEHGEARFNREVALAEQMLRDLPVGTHVVCYNGFGGTMPKEYEVVHNEMNARTSLQMFKKTRAPLSAASRPVAYDIG